MDRESVREAIIFVGLFVFMFLLILYILQARGIDFGFYELLSSLAGALTLTLMGFLGFFSYKMEYLMKKTEETFKKTRNNY